MNSAFATGCCHPAKARLRGREGWGPTERLEALTFIALEFFERSRDRSPTARSAAQARAEPAVGIGQRGRSRISCC
jgi:hypothetical protein